MLSSFQAGRHRGRTDDEPEAGGVATDDVPFSGTTNESATDTDTPSAFPNTVQDGRFPQ